MRKTYSSYFLWFQIRLDAVKIIITLHNQNNFHLAPKNYVAVICFLLQNCCKNQSDKTLVRISFSILRYLIANF